MMSDQDAYEILQVHPRADRETIQAAYERLCRRYGPDSLDEQASTTERQACQQQRDAVEQAYALLGDETQRAAYDQQYASKQTNHDAAVIDYRPLAPARGQERPRGFDAQPTLSRLWVSDPTTTQRSSRLLLPGTVAVTAVITSLVLLLSLVLTDTPAPAPAMGTDPSMNPAMQSTATSEQIVNQFEGQIVAARQVVERVPDNPDAWIQLGDALYDSAQVMREHMPDSPLYQERIPRWIEASEAYSEALALQPDNPVVRADRALSLCVYGADSGDQSYVQQGLREAQQAAQETSTNGRVLLHLGVCLVSREPPDTQAALEQWRAVLQLPVSERGIIAEAERLIEYYGQ